MTSFVLVTEGLTDQIALEMILEGHYRGADLDISFEQPLRDATNERRQDPETPGGWEQIFEWCRQSKKIHTALGVNDYLIIQIDTDVSEHPHYAVPQYAEGRSLSVSEVVDAVQDKLSSVLRASLGEVGFQFYQSKIFFAVCVQSLECWLLPLYEAQTAAKAQSLSCDNC